MPNPWLSPETPLQRKELWFSLDQLKPHAPVAPRADAVRPHLIPR
ncbi:MAG TPA: hypothetical protein VGP06_16160 [Janthinobacterium sp.]|nr:hypothetical protein [Janthinobacterium sp.]